MMEKKIQQAIFKISEFFEKTKIKFTSKKLENKTIKLIVYE